MEPIRVRRCDRQSPSRQHRHWTFDDQKHIAWSDESRFQWNRADGRVRVWRQPHEYMDLTFQQGTIQAGGGSVMNRSPPLLTPTDLWTALPDAWCQLPPALLQTLLESMPHRVAELLRAREALLDIRQNGYVNKQNGRIWSEANPQVYVETPLHPEKLTVSCALWAGGIIGPYFFKNDEGHNVTVNGDRYRAMITNFFIPELNNHDVQELWFQQHGATCHTALATIDLLKDTFRDCLISRFGPVNWPPRSCDLTPLDYFLWGC
ncbi:HTH_Tnp_Tc3_2 domain-containing protein [Trichonephila clavipes]|nr:HTH_Tnp_Tc3_2 domain-containing protein [Trichonephila clavipes]